MSASVRNKLILGVIDAAQSKKGMNCIHCQIRTGEIHLLQGIHHVEDGNKATLKRPRPMDSDKYKSKTKNSKS